MCVTPNHRTMRPDNDAVARGLQEPDNGKSRKALLQCNRRKRPFIIREQLIRARAVRAGDRGWHTSG
jgi:hypothetical protein